MTKLQRRIAWSIFLLVFLLELAAGYYVAHIRGYFYADAISRVANAFYVLHTNPPHLAAIGGVWNPLPSLFELPFLLFWRIYKPIAASGLAGVIFSSLCAAGSGVLIYRAMVRCGRSGAAAVLLALLYCFHPFMFVYGFNGMTEVPFSLMLLWLTFSFTQWLEERGPFHLVMMALALMLAFLIRYEAIPVSVMAFVAVALITLTVHRRRYFTEQGLDWRAAVRRLEGESIILLAPVLYAFFVWVLFCWIVLGNPLYFLNSGYAITAFAGEYAANATLKSLMGHPWRAGQFVLVKTGFFMIPLLVILGCRIWQRKLLQWDFLTLLLLVISTNLLQFVDLWKGLSAGWLRYFIYPFPFLVAWLPYEMKRVNTKAFTVLCLITMVGADLAMGFAWFDPSPHRVGWEEFNHLDFRPDSKDVAAKEAAHYINTRLPRATVLMDSVKTYLVIMNANQPWRFVVSSSYQFEAAVKNPRRYRIAYVLLPSTTDTDPYYMDAVNKRYPALYENGADWCVLTKQFGKYFKLYRVTRLHRVIRGAKISITAQRANPGQAGGARNGAPAPKQPDAAALAAALAAAPRKKAAGNGAAVAIPPARDTFSPSPSAPPVHAPAGGVGALAPKNPPVIKKPNAPAVPPASKALPPDLAGVYWEGVIATPDDQIIMIQYQDKHYLLRLGEQLPGTAYTLTELNQDSVTLAASGKLQFARKKTAP